MPTATFHAPSAFRGAKSRLRILVALLALLHPSFSAAEDAAPLPPPPELMADGGYDPEFALEEEMAPANPEEMRRALEAPAAVGVPPAPLSASQPPVSAVYMQQYAQSTPSYAPPPVASVGRDFTISPPASNLPTDYYNLPLSDLAADAIPGVLMPIPNDNFNDPGFRAPSPRRPAGPGLSIRQLEPFFALAKGSESVALDARTRGDELGYRDQIGKAVDAYTAIIGMADAGTEAREEAWYGVARCEYRRGNWWAAFDALERSFPDQFERNEVAGRVKLQMFIGERLWRMGNEKVPGARVDGIQLTGYQAAAQVYEKAVFNQPSAQDAPLALLRRGDAEMMAEQWDDAMKFYRQVIEYYPESEPAMQAKSSLATAVLRKEWEGGIPEAGRRDLEEHMDDVERQAARLSPEAQERRREAVELGNSLEAENRLRQAKAYLKQVRVKKSRDGAVFLLGDIVSYFPNTTQAQEAADILRGMGIEPPVALSDGTRFPLSRGWAEGTRPGTGTEPDFAGGAVRLEGQDDISEDASSQSLTPSPTRETVYDSFQWRIPGADVQP